MKQKDVALGKLVVLVSALSVFNCYAQVDPVYWAPFVEGIGPTIELVKGKGLVSIPSTSTNGASGVFGAGFRSTCVLAPGDFKIEFEFKLNRWPNSNGMRLGMGVAGAIVARNSFSTHDTLPAGEVYFASNPTTAIPTDDTRGRLRLVRKGTVISSYYRDSILGVPSWTQFASGPANEDGFVAIWAWSHNGYFDNKDLKLTIGDIKLTEGAWIGAACGG